MNPFQLLWAGVVCFSLCLFSWDPIKGPGLPSLFLGCLFSVAVILSFDVAGLLASSESWAWVATATHEADPPERAQLKNRELCRGPSKYSQKTKWYQHSLGAQIRIPICILTSSPGDCTPQFQKSWSGHPFLYRNELQNFPVAVLHIRGPRSCTAF